jgi:predicted CopG family antitoxin
MRGFTSLKGVNVDKVFKGKLKLYDGKGKRKGKRSKSKKGVGFVRDVELKAYAGAWDYYVPKAVLGALELWGEVLKEEINLTRLAKSDNSSFEAGQDVVSDVVLDLEFYKAWKEFLDELRRGWDNNKLFRCGVFTKGTCEDKSCGRVHIIKNPCKKEWCPDCGVPGSAYHMYLFAKALNYAMEMWRQSGAVGYFVITCPLELREKWKDKKVLSKVVNYLRRMLEREGFPYGYYRWHFAGDENPGVWYPHLNVLVPGGYLTPKKLKRIKRLIYKHLGVKVVYYEYAKDPERVIHMVYYITRPTWNMQVEVEAEGWSKFRKNGIWGKKYFRKAGAWKEFLKELNNIRKEKRGDVLNVALVDLKGENEEKEVKGITEEELLASLGPTDDPEIVEFPSPEEERLEELLNASFEVWWVKEALKNSICSKCGGNIKWEGVIRGLDNEYINGEVFRVGWNVWVIDERQYPKEENEKVRSP